MIIKLTLNFRTSTPKPVTKKVDQLKVTIVFMKSQLEFQRKGKMI